MYIFEELNAAVIHGDLRAVQGIFAQLDQWDIRPKDVFRQQAYLHLAHTPDIVRFLVSKGADINEKDWDGFTPLHTAIISYKSIEVLRELVLLGSNINALNNRGNSPLILAIIYRYYLAVEELCNLGADINARSNTAFYCTLPNTPLTIAVVDYIESAKIMIKVSVKKHFDEDVGAIINLEPYVVLQNYEQLIFYLYKCISEIKQMKEHIVNTNFTLYDFMNKKDLTLKPLSAKFAHIINNIFNDYPIYRDILLPKIIMCLQRGELYDRVRGLYISHRVEKNDEEIILHSDCLLKIIDYLPDKDIINFINAIEK